VSPPDDHHTPSGLTLQLWPAIIKSVTSLFGFLTLLVLAFATALFTWSIQEPNYTGYYLVSYVLVLVTFLITLTLIAFRRPHLLGIAQPYGDRFAETLGTHFYDALHPYLSNLEPGEVEEALKYWQARLSPTQIRLNTQPEHVFVAAFSAAILERARRILQPLAVPPH
jgi:hypothetical protein